LATHSADTLPMVFDFCESGVWGEATGSLELCLGWVVAGLEEAIVSKRAAIVERGSATALPFENEVFDAVITDPPYYDNVSYSNLSDFFYVWLRRSIGHLYSEHFVSDATPKKKEAIAASYRHGGDKTKARFAYDAYTTDLSEAKLILAGSPIATKCERIRFQLTTASHSRGESRSNQSTN
jgi:putative DNA methylase